MNLRDQLLDHLRGAGVLETLGAQQTTLDEAQARIQRLESAMATAQERLKSETAKATGTARSREAERLAALEAGKAPKAPIDIEAQLARTRADIDLLERELLSARKAEQRARNATHDREALTEAAAEYLVPRITGRFDDELGELVALAIECNVGLGFRAKTIREGMSIDHPEGGLAVTIVVPARVPEHHSDALPKLVRDLLADDAEAAAQ